VPFGRPRDRQAVLDHPAYYELRERLIGFLESQDHRKPAAAATRPERGEEPRAPRAVLSPA
jgi:nitrate/nitrite transport system ATP-binding protein